MEVKKYRDTARKIVLISCVKKKGNSAAPARNLYISDLFSKMMTYAESLQPQMIFILSAKYGLVNPDDIIEPYELTLNKMRVKDRRNWADKVLHQLRQLANLETDEFVFLAGEKYRENLMSSMRRYSIPMEGLSFGKQLSWLGQQTR